MLRSSDESRAGVTSNPWNGRTVAQMLDQVVADHPEAIALVEADRSVTFAELQKARNRIGATLLSLGVRDGTHVAIMMPKGHDYTALLHGLWMIGAVAIPLNTMWTSREVKRAINETHVEVLIIDTSADSTSWQAIVADLGLPTDGVVEMGGEHRIRRVVDWSAPDGPRTRATGGAAELGTPPARSSRQESLFLFTSGSSSAPKAVVLRQDGLLGTAHYFARSLQMAAGDRFLSLGPYFHAGGIVQMLVANQSGAAQYVFRKVDIPTIASVAVRDACTAVTGFDPVLVKLLDAIGASGDDLPFRVVAASPGVEVYDRLRSQGINVITMYAMSEGGNMITLASPDDATFAHGTPLPGLSVRICDADGRPVDVGQEGEICFKGWNLFRGYYNVEGATPDDRVTDTEHYFRTGDIGRLEEDGRLRYLGRLSSMIKTAGENVSATEVETFLLTEVPEVATAAVVGVPSPEWGEAVVAFVELAPGSRPFDEGWLKDSCRGRLASYKVPKRFIEIAPDQWPVAETGKLSRVTLVENFIAEAQKSPTGARSREETKIVTTTRGRCVLGMVGSDKHNKGIRTVARILRDHGLEVVYIGEHNTSQRLASIAVHEDADFVGVSVINGNYLARAAEIVQALKDAGGEDIDVVLGGLIHAEDLPELGRLGVSECFGPSSSPSDMVDAIDRLLSRRRRAVDVVDAEMKVTG